MAAWGVPVAACELPLRAPTGNSPVGYWQTQLTDSERTDELSVKGTERRLGLEVWYPASRGKGVAPKRFVSAAMAGALAGAFPFPPGFAEAVCVHALPDAEVENGSFPVVLFSHGFSFPPDLYQSLLEDLASHGYVVVAISHTHAALLTEFDDGAVDMSRWPRIDNEDKRQAFLNRYITTWIADIKFVGKTVAGWSPPAQTNPVAGHVDLSHGIGLYGHSYGGSAIARALDGATFTAGVALEGKYRSEQEGPFEPRAPLMHVIGGYNRDELSGNQYRAGKFPFHEVQINGAWHASFSDLIYLYSHYADADWHQRHRFELAPGRIIDITRAYALAYFDAWLKDRDNLLLHPISDRNRHESGAVSGYPEVELRVDMPVGSRWRH